MGLKPVRFTPADELPSPELTSGDYILLWVRDTGHGMDQATLSRVFDPFFTTKETGRGTGMGLSVVHGIVKSHGGVITAESEKGAGSIFRVYLPALSLAETKSDGPEKISAPKGSERVLWVDDEHELTDLGCRILERLGYEVEGYTSSPEALEAFKKAPDDYDIVISDYTMPKLTGGDLAREVLKIRPEMPIIICTGYSGEITDSISRELGISRVMMKPMKSLEVGEMIRDALDEKAQNPV